MAKKRGDVNSQKIKLLKLMDLLRRTSEQYSLSTEEIRSRLENIYANVDRTAADDPESDFNGKRVGIACHRHTLAKDIETLCKYGYDVENTGLKDRESTLTDDEREAINRWNIKRSRANRYYMPLGDRFSNSELRLLELALQATKTVNDRSKEDIIRKLRSQTLDSHVYGYLDNAFVPDEANLEEAGKGSIIAAPQNRHYFLQADGEYLEVGDNCREFVSSPPDAMDISVFGAVFDPVEEAMLTGSLLRFSLYDRDIEGNNIIRTDEEGSPKRYEAFPLSFVYNDGKTYLLAISKEQARKCTLEDIAAGRIDEIIYPVRLDSFYCPSLPRKNFQDYDDDELNIEVVPQVKSVTRKGLKSSGMSKSTKKTNASQERENTLANVLRIKRWMSDKENFDSLMRRNPRMYFERHPERSLREYTLEFLKRDYGVWRSLRDQFGARAVLQPADDKSEYCRAKISVYSLRLFAMWLAGFEGAASDRGSGGRLRVIDMDSELSTELINLHTQCLEQVYGDVGAKEAILNSINDDPSFDIREFVVQLVKSYTDNGGSRHKMNELREALLDCLAWLH